MFSFVCNEILRGFITETSRIRREHGRIIIHVLIRPKFKKTNQKDKKNIIRNPSQCFNTIYETHKSSIQYNTNGTLYKSDPFSTFLDATKYRHSKTRHRSRRRPYGFPLWILCLLCYCLIALFAMLAAIIFGLVQMNREKSLFTVTAITSTTSTSTTSTSTTSTTTITTSTTTTATTTSTTTTTTTTHKDCLSLNILNGSDYNGYDIGSNTATNFIACCDTCFMNPLCVAFTFRTPAGGGGCFLKNSTAGGTIANIYCTSASI